MIKFMSYWLAALIHLYECGTYIIHSLFLVCCFFQILNLDWSSGIESLKCVGRVDLTLNGSFADMILVSNGSATERSDISSLFVLSNPGQLHFYDDSCLAALMSHPEKKYSVPAIPYPGVIPTVEPYMTVGKLKLVQTEGSFSRALSEVRISSTCEPLWNGLLCSIVLCQCSCFNLIYVFDLLDSFKSKRYYYE